MSHTYPHIRPAASFSLGEKEVPCVVVVGLGNPILSDDSVGSRVAGLIRQRFPDGSVIAVKEAYAGGLRLMEVLQGYGRAVIVDAMKSDACPAGTVTSFAIGGAGETRNLCCSHDGDLKTALALGRQLGLKLPGEIMVVGIEAHDVENFSEELSSAVQAALPAAVAETVRCCGLSEKNFHEVTL